MRSFLHPSAAAAALLACLASCSGGGAGPAPPLVEGPGSSSYDVERYALSGEYDWSRGRLAATVEITLTAREPDLAAVALDSAVAEVKAVRAEDGAALPFTVLAAEQKLSVDIKSLPDRGEGAEVVLSIDYEAAAGEALRAVPGRAGDPVGARAVYTFSEPLGASSWMPCNNRPDDRALFSVEMRMGPDEAMIANGDGTVDQGDAAGRTMGYATQYPLPPYLMAFAISNFEVAEAAHGDLPVQIWHRPGVPGDYEEMLAEFDRQIGLFESLLGPYPFEKYALVMLPDYSGGMENASITFQTEITAAEPSMSGDITLGAHELGHQWFGDLTTVATWDDVWIKEGMATLLSAEATRAYEDLGSTGSLFGDSFYMGSDAIRDVSLPPEQKYTSGPYDRAAWLLTQLRGVAGEDAFWSTLRGVLEERRFGVVSTDDMVAAFEPHLGPELSARMRAAIDAHALPTLEVAASPSGGALLTLSDPGETLIAPVEIAWHRAGGETELLTLVPGEPLELTRNAPGDFVVLDPRDVHPDFWAFIADDASVEGYGVYLAPLRVPADAAAVAEFSATAGVHQLAGMSEVGMPPVGPDAFSAFVTSLDAESARAVSLRAACDVAAFDPDPAVQEAWVPVLSGAFTGEPYWRGLSWVGSYGTCNDLIDPLALFAAELADLKADLPAASIPEPRLNYLSRFDLPLADALEVWGNTAKNGSSLRSRALAARQVRNYVRSLDPSVPEDWPAWRSLVLDLLGSSEASEVLRQVIPAATSLGGPTAAENADLLDALAGILRSPVTRTAHGSAMCAAYRLTAEDQAAWAAFVAELEGAPLSGTAQEILADPTVCQ